MAFPGVVSLGNIDGTTGFVLNGVTSSNYIKGFVSDAGDVNGDDIDDVIVTQAGNTYVVFGSETGFSANLDLTALNGSNGFRLDSGGTTVSGAGDINNDGNDDLIIGDPTAGKGYVVFGSSDGFDPGLSFSELDGSNGFVLNGLSDGDQLGFTVSDAGDVDGDGIDDFVIGARNAREAYVVYGKAGDYDPMLDLSSLDGSNGFTVRAKASGPLYAVSDAGDINGDGADDVIVGSRGGAGYVVFGSDDRSIDLLGAADLDGANGFAIVGVDALSSSPVSVSGAGDINGDGFDDVIMGVKMAYGEQFAGKSFVIFGSGDGFDATVDVDDLDGTNGFRIDGAGRIHHSGASVSEAGDINDDGLDDLIIGAPGANSSYIVYGSRDGFSGTLSLDSIDGTEGFVIEGVNAGDNAGDSVSAAGDLNGDGVDDLIVSAPGANASYVIYGHPGINQAPEIISSSTVSHIENAAIVADIETSDRDEEGSGLAYQISGGADQALFSVDETSGALRFVSPPNFEAPSDSDGNNVYEVAVRVTDSEGLSDTQVLTVTVTNAVEAPLIVTPYATAIKENSTFVMNIDASDDADSENSGLVYSIGGGADAALFAINADTGALSFVDAPSAESPSDVGGNNIYNLDIVVTDSDGLSATQSMSVFVADSSVELLPCTTGDDSITGSDGQSLLLGAEGDDSIRSGGGDDTVHGGTGDDRLQCDGGIDKAFGGDGNDALYGGGGGDTVLGGNGDDKGIGQAGDDSVRGNAGNDTLLGGSGDDTLIGDSGNDSVRGGGGSDSLNGGSGRDTLRGDAGTDTLVGGGGDDSLAGGSSRDTLRGGTGDDTFNGGSGDDLIVYAATALGTGDVDDGDSERIIGTGDAVNFSSALEDLLVYSGINLGARDTDVVIGGGGFAADRNIRFTATKQLQIDVDGDGNFSAADDFRITMADVDTVTYDAAADMFILG
jgi:hypothetical protein